MNDDLMWHPSPLDLLELTLLKGHPDIVDRCQAHHPVYRSPETGYCYHPDHDAQPRG